MKAPRKRQAASFLAAAGAIGLAGLLTRACPAPCTSCATCASTILPMGASAAAVGMALVSSAGIRTRTAKRADGSAKRGE